MRTARLAAVLVLPALALAQDGALPASAGSLLWDALPPGADLVLHTPSVPRLLASAPETGFGTADAWRAAFRAQIAKWGETTGAGDRLQRGADALLGFADGEAVLAGIEIPRRGLTAPPQRAILLAFRTRAKAKELTAAVDEVVAGGLRGRWTAEPKTEQTFGRPVLSLQGPYDGLWISVEDGIVAAADHPLAIGLLYRGLERVAREGRPVEDLSGMRLRVRFGRTAWPTRWEGVTFLEREAVSSPRKDAFPAVSKMDEGAVLSWVTDAAEDVPIFPVPLPDEIPEKAKTMNARPLAVRLLPDGTWDVRGAGARGEGEPPVIATAARLGWLRAMHTGTLDTVIPMDRSVLAGPIAAAETAVKDAPATYAWRPTEEPGEIRGPAWHGPVTFLALRALHMMSTGKAPPAPAVPVPAAPAPAVPGGTTSSTSGEGPPLPDAPLPPPPPLPTDRPKDK